MGPDVLIISKCNLYKISFFLNQLSLNLQNRQKYLQIKVQVSKTFLDIMLNQLSNLVLTYFQRKVKTKKKLQLYKGRVLATKQIKLVYQLN